MLPTLQRILTKIKPTMFMRNINDVYPITATYEDVKQAKDEKIMVIDVREPSELEETGELPGSINIPLDSFENMLKMLTNEQFRVLYGVDKPKPDTPIIVSCRSGKRSANAQSIAQNMGYKNVRDYSGGWLDWEKQIQTKVKP